MILSLALFAQLAGACAPMVHINTLAAIARAESHFRDDAIHDNTTGRQYSPRDHADAVAIATELISFRGHSVDLGLMQVNSANLPGLGITVDEIFDACKNLDAAGSLLAAAYRPDTTEADSQTMLLKAISRYNTGNAIKGFSNGYVAKVLAAAKEVVPAIQLDRSRHSSPDSPRNTPHPPPSWDVFATARYARTHSDPRNPLNMIPAEETSQNLYQSRRQANQHQQLIPASKAAVDDSSR